MLRESQAQPPPFGSDLATGDAAPVRLHRTSGTTGQAMNLALSARDGAVTEEVGGRCQASAGLTDRHRVVHCLNYQMWMGGLTDHLTLKATGALVVPFGVGSTELLVRTILEVGITAISCTPSCPAVLERVIAEKFPDLSPRGCVTFGGWRRAMRIMACPMCFRTSPPNATMTCGCISWRGMCCTWN